MSVIQEFKEFALKGNVLDLAIGVIIGGAFGKIVSSLVGDIIMPVVGLLTGGVSFIDLKWQLPQVTGLMAANGKLLPPATIAYGQFIQNTVDFLIVALVLFSLIKLVNKLRRHPTPEPVATAVPTPQEALLIEIRDLLKQRNA